MKFEFNKHKKADSIKWGVVLLAVVLLTVFVVAANTEGFSNWNPYGWKSLLYWSFVLSGLTTLLIKLSPKRENSNEKCKVDV